jgi:DNA-binding response OmpR family regulator
MNVQAQTFKILVVDDEEDVRSLLGIMLEKRNFLVDQAANGKEALIKANSVVPDIILLDIHMPGMDGFQVYRRLKELENTKKIPVIFCTALRIPDIVAGIKAPGDDYMQKPFDFNVLHEKINKVIKDSRQSGQ